MRSQPKLTMLNYPQGEKIVYHPQQPKNINLHKLHKIEEIARMVTKYCESSHQFLYIDLKAN